MIFPIDRLAQEWVTTLAALPQYPTLEVGSLKLSIGRGQAGRTERWYSPKAGRFLYTKTPLSIDYPSLGQRVEGDWVTWMSGAPDECLAMGSMAKSASGDVLIGGLGLGILAWLCASNPLVNSVTVIEIQQRVIDIVAPVIAHPKIAIAHNDVWRYIDETRTKYDCIGLDIWPDVGRAVLESPASKSRARQALARGGVVRTWLDEIADRLISKDTLAKAARQTRQTQGRMLDNPQMVGDRACDFCGANPFIDCYGFCMECFIQTGVCQNAGGIVTQKTRALIQRSASGELNHLAEPYPEMYEYLVGQRSAR